MIIWTNLQEIGCRDCEEFAIEIGLGTFSYVCNFHSDASTEEEPRKLQRRDFRRSPIWCPRREKQCDYPNEEGQVNV